MKKKKSSSYLKKLLATIFFLVIVLLLVKQILLTKPDRTKLYLLGSNLGTWDTDEYWGVNENFVKNEVQRELAKGVVGSFRWSARYLPDNALLIVLDKVLEVDAEPFVVLPPNDDARAEHVVELYGDKVVYYEYGNEADWFYGMSAEDYADRLCKAIPKLRAINSEIKIGAPTLGGMMSNQKQWFTKWENRMMTECPDVKPDFISFHYYWAYETENSTDIIDRIPVLGRDIDWVRNETIRIFGVNLPIIISEWNWHAFPENYNDIRDMDSSFMDYFTKNVIKEMQSHDVFMAHQYCYGSGCGGQHLDMVNWSKPNPQYFAFLDMAKELCPDCKRIDNPCKWDNC